ncbi:DNA-binding protein [Streptomyces globisporus]|uniref:DNA-binding protein n=1 Tax=Streptomyces globisporus TaxID=1908 RepID=UPI00068D1AB3|nr:DNA-binding protein [Streptomyces globisporus]
MAHTTRFTVVGNHLAQHEQLSLAAIGLALHIQSLPAGSRIGIKRLAERFPEGETRIAPALRELEAHGYLSRTRERLPNGRLVTRTVSYNNPGAVAQPPHAAADPVREDETPATPRTPATELLLDLRRHDARFLLSERDIQHLAPVVDAWFARGAAPDAVRRTLLAALPDTLRHPAGLLSHRLKVLLPPPLPTVTPVQGPLPVQICVTCENVAFRAREPGRCPDCEADANADEAVAA